MQKKAGSNPRGSCCACGWKGEAKALLAKIYRAAKLEKHAQRTMHRKIANLNLAYRPEENLLF